MVHCGIEMNPQCPICKLLVELVGFLCSSLDLTGTVQMGGRGSRLNSPPKCAVAARLRPDVAMFLFFKKVCIHLCAALDHLVSYVVFMKVCEYFSRVCLPNEEFRAAHSTAARWEGGGWKGASGALILALLASTFIRRGLCSFVLLPMDVVRYNLNKLRSSF